MYIQISKGKKSWDFLENFCVNTKWMIPQKNFIFPETDRDSNFCKFASPSDKLKFKFNGWALSLVSFILFINRKLHLLTVKIQWSIVCLDCAF